MAAKAQIQKTDRITRNAEADRKNLDLAISGINKQFGPGALMRLGEATKMKIDVISTGSIAIDIALGTGGLPRGRICEIYGPESSGKPFCLSAIAQQERRWNVYLSMSNTPRSALRESSRVDLDNLMVAPENCEAP